MSTSIEETRWSCRLSRISRGRQSCRASKAQGMNWQHFTQPDLICTVHMSNSQANAPTSLTDPSGSVPNVVHCASQTSSSQESYKVLEQYQTGRQLRVVLEWKLPDEAGTSLGEKAARIVLVRQTTRWAYIAIRCGNKCVHELTMLHRRTSTLLLVTRQPRRHLVHSGPFTPCIGTRSSACDMRILKSQAT